MKLYLGESSQPIEISHITTNYILGSLPYLVANFNVKATNDIDSILTPLIGNEFQGFRVVGKDEDKQIYSYSNLAFIINALNDWCDESESRQITLSIQQKL